ncbi:tyrosine-type recombinase/integrase [Marinobacter nauticus]|uniref:phage integrase n=1 Tax=Marinobacter nauticus TaxID=2743 RepID=UPI001C5673D6|nr:tyrosine-type recombinase/integrase [Marinobacter nauticus]MBW3197031.1 tyrosine-type recombinase/integrase [Marinobacter nauticus]MBY6182441.1 tyrosine-type recombinase/integrase [Marinobacter nauticus]
MIKKLPSGRWQVDIQPGGRGQKRVRKSFDAKSEALRFERWVLNNQASGEDWNPSTDKRTLKDLIQQWYDSHGHTLKDGASRKKKLDDIAQRLRNPRANSFTVSEFAMYRRLRMENDGVGKNTLNHEHTYLSAVFNELIRQGEWSYPNPLKNLRKFKLDEHELTFLTQEQISRLLEECKASSNPSLYHVTRLALATGARWSEAEGVTRSNFTPHRVTYNYTKSGKSRSVPLSEKLYKELIEEVPFVSCSAAFRKAIERSGIQLPRGQLTHVCRHTFASHFVMKGGDILTLQKILGHSDVKLTMRYSHLSPDHLQSVVRLSPLV